MGSSDAKKKRLEIEKIPMRLPGIWSIDYFVLLSLQSKPVHNLKSIIAPAVQ
jgi:hypothetical protein